MDIGAQQITDQIVSSTTDYLVEYLPVIVLVAGIVLALVVIERLISTFFGNKDEGDTISESNTAR